MATPSTNEITFIDLPSKHKGEDKLSCFSFNPWKTRLVLNYKNLTYTTKFIEYPDLESELSALGLPPNEPGTAFKPYSSPTILLPNPNDASANPEPIMHSLAIANRLEKLYPEPSLHLETELHLEAEKVVEAAALVVWWDGMVNMLTETLSPRAAEYFDRTRKEVFGATLHELAALKGGEAGWKEAEKEGGVFEDLRDFLIKHKRDEGPFVRGSEVSYADFIVVALLECFSRVDVPGFERMLRFDKAFAELYKACKPWLERDN